MCLLDKVYRQGVQVCLSFGPAAVVDHGDAFIVGIPRYQHGRDILHVSVSPVGWRYGVGQGASEGQRSRDILGQKVRGSRQR